MGGNRRSRWPAFGVKSPQSRWCVAMGQCADLGMVPYWLGVHKTELLGVLKILRDAWRFKDHPQKNCRSPNYQDGVISVINVYNMCNVVSFPSIFANLSSAQLFGSCSADEAEQKSVNAELEDATSGKHVTVWIKTWGAPEFFRDSRPTETSLLDFGWCGGQKFSCIRSILLCLIYAIWRLRIRECQCLKGQINIWVCLKIGLIFPMK